MQELNRPELDQICGGAIKRYVSYSLFLAKLKYAEQLNQQSAKQLATSIKK